MIGISGSLIWSKPCWNWYLTPLVNFCEVQRAHSLDLRVCAPGIFSELLRFVQMLKRDWGSKSNGKLLHLFYPCYNCSLGSWVCGGRCGFGKTAAWIPTLAVKDLPLGRTLDDDDDDDDDRVTNRRMTYSLIHKQDQIFLDTLHIICQINNFWTCTPFPDTGEVWQLFIIFCFYLLINK